MDPRGGAGEDCASGRDAGASRTTLAAMPKGEVDFPAWSHFASTVPATRRDLVIAANIA